PISRAVWISARAIRKSRGADAPGTERPANALLMVRRARSDLFWASWVRASSLRATVSFGSSWYAALKSAAASTRWPRVRCSMPRSNRREDDLPERAIWKERSSILCSGLSWPRATTAQEHNSAKMSHLQSAGLTRLWISEDVKNVGTCCAFEIESGVRPHSKFKRGVRISIFNDKEW